MDPTEIKDRTSRRLGRSLQALNALHDMLGEYTNEDELTQADFENIIGELEAKLCDMKVTEGRKQIPHHGFIENYQPFHGPTHKRHGHDVALPPGKPRLPRLGSDARRDRLNAIHEAGEGLPVEDI